MVAWIKNRKWRDELRLETRVSGVGGEEKHLRYNGSSPQNNNNANIWCIIISTHPKIDGKLGEDAKKQPQTNTDCLWAAHPSLHMTEYHRSVHLHSFWNQSFCCSCSVKSANTHIPSAASAQASPSTHWTVFWGPHLLLRTLVLQWRSRNHLTFQSAGKVHFYIFGWTVPLGECWHCVCCKINLSYACSALSWGQTPVGLRELT